METTGRIIEISGMGPDETLVTLSMEEVSPADCERLQGKLLSVCLKQKQRKKTLTQNAYYWVLLTKVAAKCGVSAARLHNMLLRQHPRIALQGGQAVDFWMEDTEAEEKTMMEATTFHLLPLGGIDREGKRQYRLLRGSSSYTTEEMTVLLDDLIGEAKEAGVETKTPDELARMRELEKQAEERGRRRK